MYSSPVRGRDQRSREGMEYEVERHDGGTRLLIDSKLVGIDGVHREEVPVGPIAGWGSGPVVTVRPAVVTAVKRTSRQPGAIRVACARRELHGVARKIDEYPVPVA